MVKNKNVEMLLVPRIAVLKHLLPKQMGDSDFHHCPFYHCCPVFYIALPTATQKCKVQQAYLRITVFLLQLGLLATHTGVV